MLVVQYQAMYLWIMVLVLLDGIMTFYQIFLVNKKGLRGESMEMNWLMRKLFGEHITPLRFVLVEMGTQIWLWIMATLIFNYSPDTGMMFGVAAGMFIMVNLYHIMNIHKFKRMWDIEIFWKALEADLISREVEYHGRKYS